MSLPLLFLQKSSTGSVKRKQDPQAVACLPVQKLGRNVVVKAENTGGGSVEAKYNILEESTSWTPTNLSFPLLTASFKHPTVLSYSYEVSKADLGKWPAELAAIKEACTLKDERVVKANKSSKSKMPSWKKAAAAKEEDVSFFEERGDVFLFPRMMGTHLFGTAQSVTLWEGDDIHPDSVFEGKLHAESPPQVEAVNIMWKQMQEKGGALLQAPCGAGKTIMLLNLAFEKVRKKALWICVRNNLLEQTKKSLLNVVPKVEQRIGTIKGTKKIAEQIKDKDIVFCSVQMISKLDLENPEDLLSSFGLVIIDEAHTVQTPVFMGLFKHLKPKYWATATATARRADAMFDPLLWHAGGIAVSMKRTWRKIAMTWHVLKYVDIPGETPPMKTVKRGVQAGRPDFIFFMKFITQHPERNRYIIDLIKKRLAEGKIMFVGSAWKEHIYALRQLLADAGVESGILVGNESAHLDRDVIFCTYAKAGFGVDKSNINHLIDVTPWSNAAVTMTEQWVGRIRPSVEKKSPSLDSLVDNGCLGMAMRSKRKKFYDLMDCTYTTVHGDIRGWSDMTEEDEGGRGKEKRRDEYEEEEEEESDGADSFICDDDEVEI